MNRIVDVFEIDNSGYVVLEVLDIKGGKHYLNVKSEDLINYQNGEYIQKAFPYLTAGERELILTGLTPEMWDDMFGEEK
jgi:hypothetical protein